MSPASTTPFAALILLLAACDSPEPAAPAEENQAIVAEPAAPEPAAGIAGLPLDSLMRFEVSGIKSREQADWLKELFNRQEILRVEEISSDEGFIEIRYSSSHTNRDKLVRMLEVNELKVEKALYLNPDPGRSG